MAKQKFYEILYVICFITFTISIIYIVSYLYFMYKDESDIEKVQSIMNDVSNVEFENKVINEIIENKNENLIKESIINEDNTISKFKEIKSENTNMVAWIKIAETEINYPVMQGKNNDYYLNKNYKNKYSRNGSIFVDYRYDFSKDNQNLLIYGHNNRDGMMFNGLLEYEKEDFFNNHKTIQLITEEENKIYEIIAVFKSQVYNVNDTNVFRYYNYIDLSDEKIFNEYINNCKKKSLYNIDLMPSFGDEVLTLSTCEYSKENGRFVVVATRKNK